MIPTGVGLRFKSNLAGWRVTKKSGKGDTEMAEEKKGMTLEEFLEGVKDGKIPVEKALSMIEGGGEGVRRILEGVADGSLPVDEAAQKMREAMGKGGDEDDEEEESVGEKWGRRIEKVALIVFILMCAVAGAILTYYAFSVWLMRDLELTANVLEAWKTEKGIADGISVFSSVSEVVGAALIAMLGWWLAFHQKRKGGDDSLKKMVMKVIQVTVWFIGIVSFLDLASNAWGEWLAQGRVFNLIPIAIATILLTFSEFLGIAGITIVIVSIWYLFDEVLASPKKEQKDEKKH